MYFNSLSSHEILGLIQHHTIQVWWCMSTIPAFGKYTKNDQEFKVILDYTSELEASLGLSSINRPTNQSIKHQESIRKKYII